MLDSGHVALYNQTSNCIKFKIVIQSSDTFGYVLRDMVL
jgi:hypothetical protein